MLIGNVQSECLSRQVLQEPKPFPLGKILHIPFIGIGLAFKTDVLVGTVAVQVQGGTQQPFRKIKDVERNEQQFPLLPKMDTLMVDEHVIGSQGTFLQDDEGPKGKAHIIFIKEMFKNEYHLKTIIGFLQI